MTIVLCLVIGFLVGFGICYLVLKRAKNLRQVAMVGVASLAVLGGGSAGGLAIFIDNQQVEIKDIKCLPMKVAAWDKIALYDGKPLIGQNGTKFIISVIQKDPWKKPVAYVDSIYAPVACPWVIGATPHKR